MFDRNTPQRPKSKTLATPKNTAEKIAVPVPTHDQISKRAHELYESRGREDGKDQQDWLTAEQEILKQRL